MSENKNDTGIGNSSNGNSGYRNSGYWNSGYGNSGYGNSGNRNSGDWNSGYGNSCNRSSGIFCTETPQLFCFNKPTDKDWSEICHPNFYEFYLNKWIPESEMTDAEKLEQKDFDVREGYLKTYTWEEAWANYWRDCDKEEKQRVLNLPNFCPEIFKKITGIDVSKEVSCDGKRYELKEVK